MTPGSPLLYVTPVVPDVKGNGLALRAGTVLALLADRFDVSLLVVPLHGPVDATVPPVLARRCHRIVVVRRQAAEPRAPWLSAVSLRWPAPGARAAAAAPDTPFRRDDFAVVHLYRLTVLPYAWPYLFGCERAPRCHIDLDEAESASRHRLAALYRSAGQERPARFAALEGKLLERLERQVLDRFDRVYLCSAAERRALPKDGRADVRVLNNALPPGEPIGDPPADGPFRFLFVGTLAFPPNEDAARHFCLDILPHLRGLAPRAFEVVLVGAAPTEAVRQLAAIPEVRVVGAVPDVEPWYREAGAVIVPLRAGGGTRLKVLEAIRYRRPVVSTPAGIDGYALRDGDSVLVSDQPDAFARHCARLMSDGALARQLAAHAFDLFMEDHTPAAIAHVLDD